MDGPQQDASAPIFTVSRDEACDDVQLLRRIGRGDEDAMAAFYREHGRIVLAQVLLVTGERVLAEEIVQEAFIKFARSAGKKDEPAAYLRVIVVNLCRSQQRRTLIERRLAPKASPLSGVNEIDETWDVLRKLPFRQRSVLMLRYYEDLSEAEIAHVLGCRPGTVKSSLHRGLAALEHGGDILAAERLVRLERVGQGEHVPLVVAQDLLGLDQQHAQVVHDLIKLIKDLW